MQRVLPQMEKSLEAGAKAVCIMKPRAVPAYSPQFEAFWAIWPRRIAKMAAWKEWKAWGLDDDATVLPALRLQLPAFCKRDIEHVPHASTWLHQRRWEDEIAPPSATGSATRTLYCPFHEQGRFNHGRRAPRHVPTCPACKEWEAANRARESMPETSEMLIKRLGLDHG